MRSVERCDGYISVVTLQELYEEKREVHECKKRRSYADRVWCSVCSRVAIEEFYDGDGAESHSTDQR